MAYFPFFMDIANKEVLIVGGGKTALRKAETLLAFGCFIKVVAPDILPEFASLAGVKELIKRPFDESDIKEAFAVIAASGDRDVNRRVSLICQSKNIPVNAVDDTELCTFIFPSIVKREDIVCGISSGGKSPLMARYIKETINNSLPQFLGGVNNKMGFLRQKIKEDIPLQKDRAGVFKDIFALLLKTQNKASDSEINDILTKAGEKHDKN